MHGNSNIKKTIRPIFKAQEVEEDCPKT